MTISRCVFCLCLAVLAGCRSQVDPSGFSGTWVLNVNQQVLMVLTLEREGETYKGTWQRPKQFNTDGLTFSGLGAEVATETISSASLNGKTLVFVTRNPDDPADGTEFEMTLQTQESASVAFPGVPFEPWRFVRYQAGNPEVFRGWDATRSYDIEKPWLAANLEMRKIAEADQAERRSATLSEGTETADAERRRLTLALLESGQLRSGEDFRNAALVFQHGNTPEHFLLAHTFALAALTKGDATASWLAAATLDRYLHVVGTPQIYGTQFEAGTLSQQPFTPAVITDSLRLVLRVPPVAQQRQAYEDAVKGLTTPAK
jgi:hypothetical protein